MNREFLENVKKDLEDAKNSSFELEQLFDTEMSTIDEILQLRKVLD